MYKLKHIYDANTDLFLRNLGGFFSIKK